MQQQTATLHALPSCKTMRIFELRQAARQAGIRYIPSKPKAIKPAPSNNPFGGDAA